MLTAKNKEDGTYEVEKAFDHDAIYHVQVHVTARGMHVMPKNTITVGDVITEHEDHGHAEHDHSHHEHADGFSMHFMKPENVEKGKETELILHIQDDEGPMEKARVRFEIWNDDISDKHDWVDADETKPGSMLPHLFSKKQVLTRYKFMCKIMMDYMSMRNMKSK
ncbi:hypothetical protein ACI2OX_16460 [Bacillus sp. N9]